jgi:CBS domain-containing protein
MARKVKDVMTAPPHTVTPATTLREVAGVMRDRDVGGVVVAEGDTVLGVLTDRDIVVRCVADGGDPGQRTAEDVCSGRLAIVGPEDDSTEAVRVMRDHAVRRLPVVDGDRLVGIVSLGDLAVERDPGSALADISAERPNT